jgi:hypothetical protein
MRHGSVELTEDLVIVMEQWSRQYVVDGLNRMGYTELADEASRDLPDPVDLNHLEEWSIQHGLSRDDVISRMGGSP